MPVIIGFVVLFCVGLLLSAKALLWLLPTIRHFIVGGVFVFPTLAAVLWYFSR